MERFLRFYIKFQGYTIGIAFILGTFFMTLTIYMYADFHLPLEEFYDYRYMGSSALVFGVAWLTASSSLLYGIYQEKPLYLYPFVVMFMFDLFLMVARDIAVFWLNLPWHHSALLNVAVLPVVLFTSFYLMFSMIVLGKLFVHEPKVTPEQAELVVFNEEIQQAPLAQEEAVGDDVALVED